MIWLKVNQEIRFSAEFRLLKDRDSLILSPIGLDDNNNSEYFIYEGTKDVKIPLNLSFSKVDDIYIPTNTAIFVDENKLFPLALRRWKEGDSFQPFGMEGKSKKSK
jgi:tRNA(Ile)-lysidine synthase